MQLEQEIKQTAHRLIDDLPDYTSWESCCIRCKYGKTQFSTTSYRN